VETAHWFSGSSPDARLLSVQTKRTVTTQSGAARNVALDLLGTEITSCRRCPRLVEWREEVAAHKRAAFMDQQYWGRPVPGFGDPAARVLFVGLAPAAHGGNRTGRVFTGDRSGDWLFAALWRTGFANQPESVAVGDGLTLSDAYVIAAVRCAPPANSPTLSERDACVPFLRRELALLCDVRVIVALGQFAHHIVSSELNIKPRPPFGHGAESEAPNGTVLLSCYHPSQRNTFTGTLTESMFDDVLIRAHQLAECTPLVAGVDES
jgi:uracil-DNA glycosylase family 4